MQDFKLLLSRLVVVNSLVIALVILLAGMSVKDYACFLVNAENITGPQLVQMLNIFLVIVSVLSFVIAGIFHYFFAKQIVKPVKVLSNAAKEVSAGRTPAPIDVSTSSGLAELASNFNQMVETLASVQTQREEMLKDIAHELRTPLTNINGYLEALHHEVIKGDATLFGSLLDESQRITRVVELITELNAWDKGIYFLQKPFEEIEMDKLLHESVTAFDLKLQHTFSTFETDFEPAIVKGHKDGLKQVLTNLLQNTIDYNEGNHFYIRGVCIDHTYRITLSHHGQWIDPEQKEMIFDRFYRIERSRSTPGTGLGLAIARRIIEAHQGTISVETDGHHHHFSIELPLLHQSLTKAVHTFVKGGDAP